MPAEDLIMEALAQVLFKQDLILNILLTGNKYPLPMQYGGQTCPVCHNVVSYQVDITKNVVIRTGCQCKTGLQVMSVPLFPTPAAPSTGDTRNGSSSSESDLLALLAAATAPASPRR